MIIKSIKVFVCIANFLYTCYVLCNFMYFLSVHTHQNAYMIYLSEDDKSVTATLSLLLFNGALLSFFIIQHSVMASEYFKNIYSKLGLKDMERSIYNCCCAAVLHLLISKWKYLTWASLWNIDTKQHTYVWYVMISIHILAWIIIYSGCIMFDMAELAGIKQIYYSVTNRGPPIHLKSFALRRYLDHLKHPSFIGFLIIFWVCPTMSFDRFLMAILLTIYMLVMWNVDEKDFSYHKEQLQKKKRELRLFRY